MQPRSRSVRAGSQGTGPNTAETRVAASEMVMGLCGGTTAQTAMGSEVVARAAVEEATVWAAVAVAWARARATVTRAAARSRQ